MYNPPYFQNPFIKQEIIHVNGENGARALQMLPNSQALLLDDTAPLVWLAQTDGAGYKTITPYEIKPYTPKAPVDIEAIAERLEKIERMMDDGKSNFAESDDEQSEADDGHGEDGAEPPSNA